MTVWICIAYDPLPGVDVTTRLLRYGALAEHLASSGHSVVLWTSSYDHLRKLQRYARDTTLKPLANLRIELLFAPAYPKNISFARVRHNRVLAARFRLRAGKERPPDIIFAGIPCLELAEAAAEYAKANSLPVVVDIQDVWPEVYLTALPRALRWLGRLLLDREFRRARRIFSQARSLTAVSTSFLQWACDVRGRSSPDDRVFHLGYRMPAAEQLRKARGRRNEFLERYNIPKDAVLAVFLGQFAASYDISTILAAISLVEQRETHVHFVLAGQGTKLRIAQEALPHLKRVTLTGWLEYEDTLTLLQSANIGLAAYSRQATQSLPYKPFEYMAHGLAIIHSLEGELDELVVQHRLGLRYEAGNPGSLAQAVETLANEPDALAAAGARSEKLFRERFDSPLITDGISKHLDSLLR